MTDNAARNVVADADAAELQIERLAGLIALAAYGFTLVVALWQWRTGVTPWPGVVLIGLACISLLVRELAKPRLSATWVAVGCVCDSALSLTAMLVYWVQGAFVISFVNVSDLVISLPRRPGRWLAGAVAAAGIGGMAVFAHWRGWDQSGAVTLLVGYGFVYLFSLLTKQSALDRRRIAEQNAELSRSRRELETAYAQLRAYADRAEALAVEQERTRLAREIHDTVAHGLTSLAVTVQAAELVLQKDPAAARERLQEAGKVIRESLAEVRRAVRDLRPISLEREPLPQALDRLVTGFGETTGITAELALAGRPQPLSAEAELCLYRAVQEGMANAYRHGRAGRIDVTLAYRDDRVELVVRDDGRGVHRPLPGQGLTGMRERTLALGGEFAVFSEPGRGLQLRLALPAPPAETEGDRR